ncbi:MAG: phosphocarrier protein [Pseudohongiellaceae bacterium]|jgi:phosphocarrier protein
MINCKATIINKLGLHARAAARFVSTASAFGCEIKVTKDGNQVSGKSIMSVMMLAANKGTELELQFDGDDAANAQTALLELINNKFDEGE